MKVILNSQFEKPIEEHRLDTNVVLSYQRCLINTGVIKMTFKYTL